MGDAVHAGEHECVRGREPARFRTERRYGDGVVGELLEREGVGKDMRVGDLPVQIDDVVELELTGPLVAKLVRDEVAVVMRPRPEAETAQHVVGAGPIRR